MGPQYQATVDSYAATPQDAQASGNQTLGKSMEQSPVHDGFGTRSSMYDNGMDVSAQPAPVSMPPQPQNQPATAGINPSWAQQANRKRGGRLKRADGGGLGDLANMAGANVNAPSQPLAPWNVNNPMGGGPNDQSAVMPYLNSPNTGIASLGNQGPTQQPPMPPPNPGLAAFNNPGPMQGFAMTPLPEFGSMYNQPQSYMATGDTLARFAANQQMFNALPFNTRMQQGQAGGQQPVPEPTPTPQPTPQQQTPQIPQAVIDQILAQYQKSQQQAQAQQQDQTSTAQPYIPKPSTYQSYPSLGAGPKISTQNLSNDAFIDKVYQTELGRAPDAEGKAFWLAQLNKGVSQQDIERDIQNTAEAGQFDTVSSDKFINDLYKKNLGRAPDAEGKAFWTEQLKKGASPLVVEQDILGSNEYKNTASTVDDMYRSILGRAPDAEGQAYWANLLASGAITKEQMADEFRASAEAKARPSTSVTSSTTTPRTSTTTGIGAGMTPTAFVNQLYQSTLGRAPDAEGAAYWANLLNTGVLTKEDVAKEFANSAEAKANKAKGIIPDKFGEVDPFVSGATDRLKAAQDLYGNISKQNFATAKLQQQEYQSALDALNKDAEQKLQVAQQTKDAQAAAAAAEAQRQAQQAQQTMLLLWASGAFG